MKPFLNKVSSTVAGAVVVLVGCAMAGLGLTVMAFLAIFALAAFGLAILAKPFLDMSERNAEDVQADTFREEPAAA